MSSSIKARLKTLKDGILAEQPVKNILVTFPDGRQIQTDYDGADELSLHYKNLVFEPLDENSVVWCYMMTQIWARMNYEAAQAGDLPEWAFH